MTEANLTEGAMQAVRKIEGNVREAAEQNFQFGREVVADIREMNQRHLDLVGQMIEDILSVDFSKLF